MEKKVKIDFKMFEELTDDDMELIEYDIKNTDSFVFDGRGLDIPYEHMEERSHIFNYTTPVLKDKKVLNNVMKEFNRLYGLYETKKISDEELTFTQSIAEDNNEFRLNLLYLLSGIYVMCYGFCAGIFDEVGSKIQIDGERLYIDESYLEGVYVNGEKIGKPFVYNIQKLRDNALDVCKYFRSTFA